jgi:AraC-like DNA-binding protein
MPRRGPTPNQLSTPSRYPYIAGGSWLALRTDNLLACALWGAIDTSDVQRLLRAVKSELQHPRTAEGQLLVDTMDVTSVSSCALDLVRDHLKAYESGHQAVIGRCAVVRPKTFVLAALAEGLSRIVPIPFETAIFSDLRASLRFLGASKWDGLDDELVAIRVHERAGSSITARLQPLFAQRLRFVTIEDGASALDLSTRGLQRQLQAAGTTFQRELNLARVKAAQGLMGTTALPLIRIAAEVGCASPSHLTVLFHKTLGQSPSAWRRRHLADKKSSGSPFLRHQATRNGRSAHAHLQTRGQQSGAAVKAGRRSGERLPATSGLVKST